MRVSDRKCISESARVMIEATRHWQSIYDLAGSPSSRSTWLSSKPSFLESRAPRRFKYQKRISSRRLKNRKKFRGVAHMIEKTHFMLSRSSFACHIDFIAIKFYQLNFLARKLNSWLNQDLNSSRCFTNLDL